MFLKIAHHWTQCSMMAVLAWAVTMAAASGSDMQTDRNYMSSVLTDESRQAASALFGCIVRDRRVRELIESVEAADDDVAASIRSQFTPSAVPDGGIWRSSLRVRELYVISESVALAMREDIGGALRPCIVHRTRPGVNVMLRNPKVYMVSDLYTRGAVISRSQVLDLLGCPETETRNGVRMEHVGARLVVAGADDVLGYRGPDGRLWRLSFDRISGQLNRINWGD